MSIIKWDDDGYPTEESLKELHKIVNTADNIQQVVTAFYDALRENYYPDCCGIEEVEVRGDNLKVWGYHTMGWSGNENIIGAIEGSWVFRWLLERYDRGGHYYFSLEGMKYVEPEQKR